jgi:hypothetical protein
MINYLAISNSISKIFDFESWRRVKTNVFDPVEDDSFGGQVRGSSRFLHVEYSWLIMNIWNERYYYNFNFQLSFSKNN